MLIFLFLKLTILSPSDSGIIQNFSPNILYLFNRSNIKIFIPDNLKTMTKSLAMDLCMFLFLAFYYIESWSGTLNYALASTFLDSPVHEVTCGLVHCLVASTGTLMIQERTNKNKCAKQLIEERWSMAGVTLLKLLQ